MDYDSSGYKSKKRSEVYSSDNEDSYSTYSEDFEDDSRTSSYEDIKKANRRHQQRRHVKKLSITDDSSTTVTSAKKSAQSEPRRRTQKAGVKLGWRSNSFTKDAKRKSGTKDVVAARMMSARRNRINVLSNEIREVQSRLNEVLKENKLLKTLQHRQEKALHRFEDTENDLPRLISQHSEEQRVLKARLRKSQDTERVLEGKLRDTNDEMTKMENTLKRLKKMVYDRKLGERSELARQLASAEDKLYEAERKNKELEKKIELSTSSYMRQINSERSKHKETKDRLDVLHEEYQIMQNKLKEKERALEVSNIYALRVKQSPEKSFISGKVAVLSPRRIQDKPAPQKHDPSPLPLVPTEEKAAPPPKPRTPTPPTVQSRPPVSTAMTNATDFRKTVRSPDGKSPTLMDIKQPITQDISKDLAGVKIPSKESDWRDKEDENRGKSVFLTANFESPMITPSNTFISESSNVGNTAPSAAQENQANQVEDNKTQNGHTLPNGNSVAQEIKRKEKQLEMEKKKMEEERKKKAALLAKIKDVEENDSIGTPTGKKNEDSLRQLLSNNNSNQGNPKVENLHLGIPSTLEQNKKLDPELTFGGYAPTIAPPKRKPRSLTHQKKPASPSGSESDEPMLDLVSGKSKKPESDLLANLFPGQAKQKRKPEQSFVRESSQLKTTPRAKPVHSGYPWEKNVMPASLQGKKSNGDAKPSNQRAGNIYTSPIVKAAPSNDDIEELTL
uniref:lebercilin isoform X2 n=1 Tax=Ciona intestinalis TaxID=7719 RepID=UPI000EF4B7DF|nr:lebercilin isoform X2 [Ciona intestinalis]|eukprot:XP_026694080.1 lebercilin isoform X2 [Ciona intestinalis]